ncbi:hypothetical protein QJQ45_017090 [Haematococcus lacustris]|nr:hypothetical protein QJQ45_017090 [Haematococcus lacustris]
MLTVGSAMIRAPACPPALRCAHREPWRQMRARTCAAPLAPRALPAAPSPAVPDVFMEDGGGDPEILALQEHQKRALRPSAAEDVRTWVALSRLATLSTLSSDPDTQGAPSAAVVQFAVTSSGCPVLAVSGLSAHTADLAGDPRAALTVTAPAFNTIQDGRATLQGRVREVKGEEVAALRTAFLAKYPDAFWVDFADFRWWVMDQISAVRYNGGFAKARKLSGEEYLSARPDPVAAFSVPVCSHMNSDHQEDSKAMVAHYVGLTGLDAVKLLDIDRLGMNAESGKQSFPAIGPRCALPHVSTCAVRVLKGSDEVRHRPVLRLSSGASGGAQRSDHPAAAAVCASRGGPQGRERGHRGDDARIPGRDCTQQQHLAVAPDPAAPWPKTLADRSNKQYAQAQDKLEEDMAEVSMERHGHAKQLVVFFGAAGIGTAGGWGADAVLRACCKVVCRPRGAGQRRGRVVLVDEHGTSRVSSAVNGKQPCEVELNTLSATRPAGWKPPAGQVEQHLVRPAWSQQRDQPVRGLMWCPVVPPRKPPQAPRSSQAARQPAISEPGPSTPPPAKRSKRTKAEPAAEPTQPTKGKGKAAKAKPAPQPGRWLDRDCNAALNMQRIGESRWSPLELCYWPDQGALPAKGKEYPGPGYKRLQDKPPKAQEQEQQQPAVAQ